MAHFTNSAKTWTLPVTLLTVLRTLHIIHAYMLNWNGNLLIFSITRKYTNKYSLSNPTSLCFSRKKKGKSNLLPHQKRALSWLHSQDSFLIVSCNKNLGPAIIKTEAYLKMAWQDHFQDTIIYQWLDITDKDKIDKELFKTFDTWFSKYKDILSSQAYKFLNYARDNC